MAGTDVGAEPGPSTPTVGPEPARKRRRKLPATPSAAYRQPAPHYLSSEQEAELKRRKGLERLELVLEHHRESEARLANRFQDIIARYSNVDPEEDDEIDLENQVVVKNRGALQRMSRRFGVVWMSDDEDGSDGPDNSNGDARFQTPDPQTDSEEPDEGGDEEPQETMGPARLADLKDMIAFMAANKRMMGGSPLKDGDMVGLPDLSKIDTRSADDIDMEAFDAANAKMMTANPRDEDDAVDLADLDDEGDGDNEDNHESDLEDVNDLADSENASDYARSSDGGSSIGDPDYQYDDPESDEDDDIEWSTPRSTKVKGRMNSSEVSDVSRGNS